MEIENEMLYPNCSEFTMRIRTDRITKEEKDEILKTVENLQEGNYDMNDWFPDEEGDTRTPPNIEIYANECDVFGVPHIKVSGETGDMGQFFCDWLDKKGIQYENEE